MEQAPVFIILFPFFGAIFVGLVAMVNPRLSFPLTALALAGSLTAAFATMSQVLVGGPLSYHLGGWLPPRGIEFAIDSLNILVAEVIIVVAALTAISAVDRIREEFPARYPYYYSLYLLHVTGLLGMTLTGDAFNLYVFLEVSALTTYALIALGGKRALLGTFNYIMVGTIGATFYLLGVGYLYAKTGTLNMADLANILPSLFDSGTVLVAFCLILTGVWIKMAFFPMHGWLPNAYSYAPTTTSCLVAPLATKVSVYIMIRMMFGVFGAEYVFTMLDWNSIVVGLAAISILAGSIFALAQRNLRKMLSYVIVAEVGYMVGGVWLANANGIAGASFHILADAMMTVALFLFVTIVVTKTGGESFDNLKGLFAKMPYTMAAFLIAACSMIGVPPTCGFFSKWYLISGALEAGEYIYLIALLVSSLVNAVLFFRIIEHSYFSGDDHAQHDDGGHHAVTIDEAPAVMLVPLWVASLSLLVIGIWSQTIMQKLIFPFVPV